MWLEDGQREAGRLPGICAVTGVGIAVRDITGKDSGIARPENLDLRPDMDLDVTGQHQEQFAGPGRMWLGMVGLARAE
jgi:hypothetical protein